MYTLFAEKCRPGYISESGLAPCKACPLGEYKEGLGAAECKRCPAGTWTRAAGTGSKDDCTELGQYALNFVYSFLLSLAISLCLGGYTYATFYSICPPVCSHIPFLGRLCMPAPSVCFWTPRLSLGHPGSFTSVHELKCMRTQTAPLFNVPLGRRGTTTRVVHPYPHCTCPSLGLNPGGCMGRPAC